MPKHHSLSREILLVIIIKLILLSVLWACCFSHPIAKHLSAADISNHLLKTSTTRKNLL
ncbi:hypothetical protein BH10PSE19_BH10PSE19_23170 [soil metagenome]